MAVFDYFVEGNERFERGDFVSEDWLVLEHNPN
jgi:hypothetical protein